MESIMGTEENNTKFHSFTIENNIIKGEEKNYSIAEYDIEKSIFTILDEHPNHVAEIDADTGKKTTFNEMKICSIRCALWMQKQEIGSGDIVVVYTENHSDVYIPMLASFLVGAIFNPWHRSFSPEDVRQVMSVTRPKVIFSSERTADVLREYARMEQVDAKIVVFENNTVGTESLYEIIKLQTNEEVHQFRAKMIENPEDPAMIFFSSGTTGYPKPITHSYKTLFMWFKFIPYSLDNYIILSYSPVGWITNTTHLLNTILMKATRIITNTFDTKNMCKIIEEFKVNWIYLSTSMLTQLYKSNILKKYNLKSLKFILTSGSKSSIVVTQELKNSLPNTFIGQAYGMTEMGEACAIQTDQCKRCDSVGFVLPNVQCKVIDIVTGEALGPHQPGELCVKIPTLMIGYYKNPSATREIIDKQGWIHTGDSGYYMENGEIIIIDRIEEIMKYRGHQVTSFEIENILLSHSGVLYATVVPVPHRLDGQHPTAFVVTKPGVEVTEQELVHMSSTLGEYKKLWGGVKFLTQMPHSTSTKINRKALKEIAKSYAR